MRDERNPHESSGRGGDVAAIHRDVAEQALWYVKQAISCMGFDPFDSDDEWQGFIESYGNAGAYLMSAQSTLEEAIRRVAA